MAVPSARNEISNWVYSCALGPIWFKTSPLSDSRVFQPQLRSFSERSVRKDSCYTSVRVRKQNVEVLQVITNGVHLCFVTVSNECTCSYYPISMCSSWFQPWSTCRQPIKSCDWVSTINQYGSVLFFPSSKIIHSVHQIVQISSHHLKKARFCQRITWRRSGFPRFPIVGELEIWG